MKSMIMIALACCVAAGPTLGAETRHRPARQETGQNHDWSRVGKYPTTERECDEDFAGDRAAYDECWDRVHQKKR